jgi:hypothetical protein
MVSAPALERWAAGRACFADFIMLPGTGAEGDGDDDDSPGSPGTPRQPSSNLTFKLAAYGLDISAWQPDTQRI